MPITKQLKEWWNGWSDDVYCRVCGEELTVWTTVTKADPQTGKPLQLTEHKACLKNKCVYCDRSAPVKDKPASEPSAAE